MRGPYVVGICGGIGSGKSAAAAAFERLGARVIDADRIAHEVLLDPRILAAVRARFGDGVLAAGAIDRDALGRAVFGDQPGHDEARRALEAIVHPEIVTRMRAEMRRLRSSARPPAVIVVDAPLLVGSGLEAECDEIVFVDAPDEARVERTRRTRGWTEAVHRARERAQGDLARRRAAATRVLENRGSVADLERAAEDLYATWAGPR